MISSVYTGMIIVTMGNDALIALRDTKQHTRLLHWGWAWEGEEYRPAVIYRNSNEQTKHKLI